MSSLTSGNAWDAACNAGGVMQLESGLLPPAAPQAARVTKRVIDHADGKPADEALIKAVLDGDADCFAPLVTRYQTRVMRFILKYEYNTHDAQDLAQETFLQAFRALPSFNYRARFSTWLTGIAFNLIKNHISRTPTKQNVHLDIDDLPEGATGSSSDDPARDYENRQLLAAMARAVAALPQHMHDAMVLVASEGLSYEEAADTLGVPVGTVKSRLCRARVQLADALSVYRVV